MARHPVLLAVLLAAVVLAGCGGAPTPGDRPEERPRTARETVITPQAPAVAEPPQKRPNVLVIETDDMRWDELRFMPHVRRLIQQRGLSFENSFAPYPLCCPSRASFLTGQYAHNHHVYSHVDPFGFRSFHDRRTLATVLQKAGYRTALVGKYLNGYGEQPLRGSGASSLTYVPPGWTQWLAGSDHLWHAGDPVQGGTYSYFDLVQNVNGQVKAFPGRYSTGVLAAQTRRLIDRFGHQRNPWFIWWNPVAPHHGSPIESDDPLPSRRTDGSTSTWVTPARPDWVKGRFDREITHGAGTPSTGSAEDDVSDKPRYLRKLPELTLAERDAETEVTRQRAESLFVLDVQIGRTLSRLSASGQLANTVVMFTSDNGYYLGEHRKRQGKINLHEPSLRVPLVVAGPGIPGAPLRPGHHRRPRPHPRGVRRHADAARRRHRPGPPDQRGRPRLGPAGGDRGDDAGGGSTRARHRARARSPLNTRGPAPGPLEAHPLLHRRDRVLRPGRGPAGADATSRGCGGTPVCATGATASFEQLRDCRRPACRAELPRPLTGSPRRRRGGSPTTRCGRRGTTSAAERRSRRTIRRTRSARRVFHRLGRPSPSSSVELGLAGVGVLEQPGAVGPLLVADRPGRPRRSARSGDRLPQRRWSRARRTS